MRIRSTKPEFWRSKTIAALAWDVRLVLKGLESYVDDNGVGKDDIALIAADVFPRDLSGNPRDTLARLSEAISGLTSAGLVARYEVDGEDLLYIDRWKDLQRIDKPGRGRFPRPDGTFEYIDEVDRSSYRVIRDTLARAPEVVAPGTGEQGSRGTEEQGNRHSAVAELTSAFDQAWAHWPKKQEKKKAFEKFLRLAKTHDAEVILAHVVRFGDAYAATTETQFVPGLLPWLNGERWTDDLPKHRTVQRGPTRTEQNLSVVARYAAMEQDEQRGITA